jgi:hypothetical protein
MNEPSSLGQKAVTGKGGFEKCDSSRFHLKFNFCQPLRMIRKHPQIALKLFNEFLI